MLLLARNANNKHGDWYIISGGPRYRPSFRTGFGRMATSVTFIGEAGHNEEVRKRVLQQILSGAADANVRFEDLRSLLSGLGFEERIRGDHHIFSKAGVAEILNLQPRGSQAKPYQVKQV